VSPKDLADLMGQAVELATAPLLARIAAAEQTVAAAEQRVAAAEQQVVALEQWKAMQEQQVSGVTWAGVFAEGRRYREGELVSLRGLWLTRRETTARPGTTSDYVLIVKQQVVER
jgi:hypothetical protein